MTKDGGNLEAPGAPGSGERGVALMLALLLLTLMTAVVYQLFWTTQVEERLVENARDDTKVAFASRGILGLVRAHLRADRNDPEHAGFDSLREGWARELNQDITIGDVTLTLQVEDCERRLNVNLLAQKETRAWARDVLVRLLQRLEVEEPTPEEIADRIADFLDPDTDGDFESGARNGPVLSPEELLVIEGIPGEIWHGSATGAGAEGSEESGSTLGGLLESVGLGGADEELEPRPGLLTFLTAWGTGRLNPNTADIDLMFAVLPPNDAQQKPLDREAIIEEIDRFRTGGEEAEGELAGAAGVALAPAGGALEGEPPGQDFRSIDDLKTIPGLQNIFPPPAQGGKGGASGASSTGEGGQPAPPQPLPRELLTVSSQDFLVTIEARATGTGTQSDIGLVRRFEALLRRGDEEFSVLMWRELTP